MVGVIINILEGLGVSDPKEQDDILDVVCASSMLSLKSLTAKDFTDLVTSALNLLCTKQEEELRKAKEEREKCSHEIADALFACRQEEAARKEKEEMECELELKKKAEHEKEEEMAHEKELMELDRKFKTD